MDIWCSERAQPMIAFSADSASATTSMIVISQSSVLPPLENTFPAKVEKIVAGSTSAGLLSALAPSTTMKLIGIMV